MTKIYGENLLISESAAALLPKGMFNKKLVDRVRVLGMSEPVVVYSLKESSYDSDDDIIIRKIVEMYLNGKFELAMDHIGKLDSHLKNPHMDLIFSRCEEFVKKTSTHWDGTYTMTHK